MTFIILKKFGNQFLLDRDDDRLQAYELEHGKHFYPEFTAEALASLRGTEE